MRRVLKRIALVVSCVVLLLIVVSGAGVLTLQTDWGREILRRKLTQVASESVHGEVKVKGLVGNPLTGVTLKNIEVVDANQNTVIAISEVIIEYELWALVLEDTFHSSSVEVVEPRVFLKIDDNGQSNVQKLLVQTDDDDSSLGLVMEKIKVRDGMVQVSEEGGADKNLATLEALQVSMSIWKTPRFLAVKSFDFRALSTKPDSEISLEGEIEKFDDIVMFRSVKARAGASYISIEELALGSEGLIPTEPSAIDLKIAGRDLNLLGMDLKPELALGLDGVLNQRRRSAKSWGFEGDLKIDETEHPISAWFDVTDENAGVRVDVKALDFQDLNASWPESAIEGRLAITTELGKALANSSADVALQVRGSLLGVSVGQMKVKAAVSRQDTKATVELRSDRGVIRGDGTLSYDGDGLTALDARLKAQLKLHRIRKRVHPIEGWADAIELESEIAGPIDSMQSKGTLSFSGVHTPQFQARKGTAAWDLKMGDGIPVGYVSGGLSGTRIGDIALETVKLRMQPNQSGGSAVSLHVVKGSHERVVLDGQVSQKKKHWLFDVHRFGAKVGATRWSAGGGQVRRYNDGKIVVDDLRLKSGTGTVTVSGRWSPKFDLPETLSLVVSNLDLGSSVPFPLLPMEFRGVRGTVAMRVAMSTETPLSCEVALRDVYWSDEVAPVSADLEAKVSENRVGTVKVNVTHDFFKELSGSLELNTPKRWRSLSAWTKLGTHSVTRTSWTAREVDLTSVGRHVGLAELGGSAAITMSGKDGFRSMRMSSSVTQLAVPGMPGTAFGVMSANVDGPKGGLNGTVNFSGGGVAEFFVDANSKRDTVIAAIKNARMNVIERVRVNVSKLPLGMWISPTRQPANANSMIDTQFIFEPRQDKLTWDVALTNLEHEEQKNIEARVHVDGNTKRLATTVTLGFNNQSPLVTGKIGLRTSVNQIIARRSLPMDAALSGGLTAFNLSLAKFDRILPIEGFSGVFNAQIDILGTLSKPSVVGDATLRRVRYGTAALPNVEAKFSTRENRTDALVKVLASKGHIVAKMRGLGGPSAKAEIKAEQFGLRFLNPVLLGLRIPIAGLDGVVNGTLRANWGQPLEATLSPWTGGLSVTGGTIGLPRPIEPLHDVKADLRVLRSNVQLSISGSSGKGSVTGTVSAELDKSRRPRFTGLLTTSELPVATKGLKALLTSTTNVVASQAGRAWNVDVGVDKGKVRLKSLPFGGALHSSEPLTDVVFVGEQQNDKKPSVGSRFNIDIHTLGDSILIRGDKINIFAGVNLQANIMESELRVSGRTTVGSGYIVLFDRRYSVEKARIEFNEINVDDSVIELAITRDYPEARVEITVSGTIEKPVLTMKSEPSIYSQSQILSLIINGVPGGQTGQESADDAALSAIAGLVSQQLASAIKEPLGVDSLQLGTEEGGKISSISVGKWISDKIFLAYRRHFEASPTENQDEAILEWWLRPTWLLEVRGGDAGAASGDILWILRY